MNNIDYLHIYDCYDHKLKYKDGRQQNFIDYSQYFIKKYPEINNCLLFEHVTDLEIYTETRNSFEINNLRNLTFDYSFKTVSNFYHNDILICDFAVLLFLIQYDLPIHKYKEIFVFDCLELTVYFKKCELPVGIHADFSITQKSQDFLRNNKDKITFLVTPYNMNDLKDYKYIEYYKKINFDIFKQELFKSDRKDDLIYYYSITNEKSQDNDSLINNIKEKYPNIIFTTEFRDLFEYKNILYTAKPYVGFIEQFGRQIFEFKHFDYNVIIDQSFQVEEKTGLDYYLEYDRNLNIMNENFLDIIMKDESHDRTTN